MIKDTAISSFGCIDGFGASFPSQLAGSAGRKGALPVFYSVTPPLTFLQADNRSGFDGLPPEGTSAEGIGVFHMKRCANGNQSCYLITRTDMGEYRVPLQFIPMGDLWTTSTE